MADDPHIADILLHLLLGRLGGGSGKGAPPMPASGGSGAILPHGSTPQAGYGERVGIPVGQQIASRGLTSALSPTTATPTTVDVPSITASGDVGGAASGAATSTAAAGATDAGTNAAADVGTSVAADTGANALNLVPYIGPALAVGATAAQTAMEQKRKQRPITADDIDAKVQPLVGSIVGGIFAGPIGSALGAAAGYGTHQAMHAAHATGPTQQDIAVATAVTPYGSAYQPGGSPF